MKTIMIEFNNFLIKWQTYCFDSNFEESTEKHCIETLFLKFVSEECLLILLINDGRDGKKIGDWLLLEYKSIEQSTSLVEWRLNTFLWLLFYFQVNTIWIRWVKAFKFDVLFKAVHLNTVIKLVKMKSYLSF